jgi:hypothetical protein
MSPWSLHQDAAEQATSYFTQTGPTLPAKALDASKVRLLNVLERHLSVSHELPIVFALLTTKLLQSMVEVVAEGGHRGVVGANGGLGDLQGPLVLGAGAGQIAEVDEHGAEVAVPSGHLGVVPQPPGTTTLPVFTQERPDRRA